MSGLAERAGVFSPIAWEMIPDLGLYMDQVMTFVEREFSQLYGAGAARLLTPAMVNNYVKRGLIPRPQGKKYGREQLALLLMLVPLKQVLSMDDLEPLLRVPPGGTVREAYENYRSMQQAVLAGTVREMTENRQQSAMRCAVTAAAYRLACEEMLSRRRDAAGKPSDEEENA